MYTDYSGHLIASPSLGVYSPSMTGEPPLVCSLSFPRFFMHKEDEENHKAYAKSTALESIGFLAILLIDPLRFIEKTVVITSDNAASVQVLKKGHSRGDPWATTICRAARVVAAGLGCQLQTVWEPCHPSCPTHIRDNLTHNFLDELEEEEIDSYLQMSQVRFPLLVIFFVLFWGIF